VPDLAVTAIGADRPGIVATVAEVLRDRGGNIEDSAMTILGGRFAIMLIVAVEDDPEALRGAIVGTAGELDLEVHVAPVASGEASAQPTHVLSVYGSDRPGIIAAVSRTLAELEVNITDLTTRVLAPEDEPVYAMVLEVAIPDELGEDRVREALELAAGNLGVDHTLRELGAETY
jgi:glycine cleavage system transcriptional repressor